VTRKRWDKLPIEPLDEGSFERIARRLETTEPVVPAAAPGRRPRRWVVPALAMAAASGVLVAWLALRNEVPVAASNVTTQASGTRVTAGGVVLDVGPYSTLSYEGDLRVVLEKGQVLCDVMPRGTRPPVVVEAGDVTVRVVGTRFAVYREGASARVEVEHGIVEVLRGGQSARVGAGEKWPVVKVEAETPAPEQAEPAPKATHEHAPPPRHTAPPPRHATPTPAPSPRERYEAAAALESKDPTAARAMYAELARGDDAWAQNSLYAQARLAHERGQRDEAARLCRQYLARFPSGANAQDARELLDKLK
jgi:FecR-like protein